MPLSPSRIPQVPMRVRRKLGPPPDVSEPAPLPPALTGLLQLRHRERMRRAELHSLHPEYLDRIGRQLETEIAAERNMARGRRALRHEIHAATDPGRAGLDFPRVKFPAVGCVACEIARPVLWGVGMLCAPFGAYFALGLILLI